MQLEALKQVSWQLNKEWLAGLRYTGHVNAARTTRCPRDVLLLFFFFPYKSQLHKFARGIYIYDSGFRGTLHGI